MEFKEIIKDIMLEEKVNQTQLAKKLDIKPNHLNDWVRGKSVPSYYHLRNICRKLEISGDRILGLSDN